MDPSLFLIMSAAKQEMQQQQIHAENMSNSHVLGYKASRSSVQPLYVSGGRINPKAYIEVNSHHPDMKDGPIDYTGNPLDIAMRGNKWIAVVTGGGDVGFVHSARLTHHVDGFLVTEMGYQVSDANGQRLEVDNAGTIQIMNNGEVFSRDVLGGVTLSAEIPVYRLNYAEVARGATGLIEATGDEAFERIAEVTGMIVGGVEKTNVSTAEVMADMMVTQENYKANMSSFRTYRELATSSTDTLLR